MPAADARQCKAKQPSSEYSRSGLWKAPLGLPQTPLWGNAVKKGAALPDRDPRKVQ